MLWLFVLLVAFRWLQNAAAALSDASLGFANIMTTTTRPSPGSATGSMITLQGYESATACNAQKLAWDGDSIISAISEITVTTTYTAPRVASSTEEKTTHTFLSNPRPYTLCDGYTRFNGTTSVTTNTIISTTITTIEDLSTSTIYDYRPPPTCTIPSSECSVMQSQYNASLTKFLSANTQTPSRLGMTSPTSVICGVQTIQSPTSHVGPAQCYYQTLAIQLLYWPVSTSLKDLCTSDTSKKAYMPVSISGAPSTMKYKGTTLTSPTVYMDISALVTHRSGTTYPVPQSILALAPESVSSQCAQPNGTFGQPQQVDYGNFNAPVPASAYRCQAKCFTYGTTENLCSTIWNDYNPNLAVPSQFYSSFTDASVLAPSGGFACNFIAFDENNIIYDPPLALQEATTVAPVSRPHGTSASHTPASPASAVQTQLPNQTVSPSQPVHPLSDTQSSYATQIGDPTPSSPKAPQMTANDPSMSLQESNSPPADSGTSATDQGQSMSSQPGQSPVSSTSSNSASRLKVIKGGICILTILAVGYSW